MAKKVFTDESLETLIDETKSLVSTKADSGHTHSVATRSASGFLSAEDKTQLDNGGIPIVTTAGTGAAYTATVDGMTSLTVGAKITIIPHTVSTILAPTLNVNNLGAKAIRMPITYNTSASSNGVLKDWLASGKPVTVQYNGSYWLTVDICRPSAQYLYGTVPIANGGTGATTASAARTNLDISATNTPYTNTDSGLISTTVQDAIDESAIKVYSNNTYNAKISVPSNTEKTIYSITLPAGEYLIFGFANFISVTAGKDARISISIDSAFSYGHAGLATFSASGSNTQVNAWRWLRATAETTISLIALHNTGSAVNTDFYRLTAFKYGEYNGRNNIIQ